jgi:hypothetical protein
MSGGIIVPGRLGVAIGDKLSGKSGAQERQRAKELAAVTPAFGRLGFLAVTENEIALLTIKVSGLATATPQDVVARVPRGDVVSAQLGGGWSHLTYYILSAAPLRIVFTDGNAWEMEVSRFFRKNGKKVVRALG